jgi:Protein of unknown function (DUF1570)
MVTVRRIDRSKRRPGRALAVWATVSLLFATSCRTLSDHTQPLVPTRYQVRTGGFVLFSNFPLKDDPPAISALEALERDLAQHLDFHPQEGDDPVEIYVLDDRNAFIHFLKFHFPELPRRRAFFLAQGNQRVVYTYASPQLAEDLRHEATHALLRGTYGDLPLWIDEGLAEYFESDLTLPGALASRLSPITDDLKAGWLPDLARLESLSDIRDMSPRDYRESWAWVHLFINGSKPGRSVLLAALDGLNDKPGKLGLTEKGATNSLLLAHLSTLQSLPTHIANPGDSSTVRLQDRAVASTSAPPTPPTPAPSRSLWRRMRAWVGM